MYIFGFYTGWAEWIALALLLSLLIQVFYYAFFFARLAFYRPKEIKQEFFPPVSVIICARSESARLIEYLPFIFEQDYPSFEVIVVNDRSWDDSKDILRAFEVRYPNLLRVIHIEESTHPHHGKKMALTIGIKGARHEVLLLTDADCKPQSNQWIKEMVSAYGAQTEIVLGYSPYKRQKGLLNKLIRFDTFQSGLNYLSFALAGVPYMGVGRNLSYQKSLFFRQSGFKTHYHIASGDDDLLINAAAHSRNTAVCIEEKARVTSLPKTTWEEWYRQKKRHFTTAPHYRFAHKLLLGLFPFSFWLMVLSSIVLGLIHSYLFIILGTWLLRILLQIVIFSRVMRKLGDRDLLWAAPFWELCLQLIHPAIYFSNRVVKANRWN